MSSSIFPLTRATEFIPSLWTFPSSQLTREYIDTHYLQYPVGQGSQTIPNSLIITDGTTNNTISNLGYTTKNSTQNSLHYLNFSDNSATGVGAIQKSQNFVVNPSTGTLTSTGLITGAGLTLSGANNITLGSGATPTAGQLGYVYSSPTLTSVSSSASPANGVLLNYTNIPIGTYVFTGTIAINTTSATTINYFNLFLRIGTTNVQGTSPIGFPTNIPSSYGSSYQITGVINQTIANTSINLFTTFGSASGTWLAIGTLGQLIRIA